MKQLSARWTLCSGVALSIAMLLSCNEGERGDAAVQLQVPVGGSLQNPAWSPTGLNCLHAIHRGI